MNAVITISINKNTTPMTTLIVVIINVPSSDAEDGLRVTILARDVSTVFISVVLLSVVADSVRVHSSSGVVSVDTSTVVGTVVGTVANNGCFFLDPSFLRKNMFYVYQFAVF